MATSASETPQTLQAAPEAPAERPVRSPAPLVVAGILGGALLAVVWSFELVDSVIGESVADTLLGEDAKTAAFTGIGFASLFAFVAGLAGTFTACNIAAFSAFAPLSAGSGASRGSLLRSTLVPFGWLALGACSVSAVYGAAGVLLGDRLPQLSTDTLDSGMPVRLLQSSVVFTLIGVALLWLGLAAIGVLPDPLARLEARHPRARVLAMGVLIGLFLVGRPYGLFFRMFTYAADEGNPAFGAFAFVLQSLGNVTLMAVLLVAVQLLSRGRFGAWLTASPRRIAAVTAVSLLVAGSFTVLYWGVRVPDMFGAYGGWWPVMPWNE